MCGCNDISIHSVLIMIEYTDQSNRLMTQQRILVIATLLVSELDQHICQLALGPIVMYISSHVYTYIAPSHNVNP